MNENNLKGISEPIIQRPELMTIIEKLRFIVSDYSETVNITENKLQLIKKFDEYPIKQTSLKESECFIDEINTLYLGNRIEKLENKIEKTKTFKSE